MPSCIDCLQLVAVCLDYYKVHVFTAYVKQLAKSENHMSTLLVPSLLQYGLFFSGMIYGLC